MRNSTQIITDLQTLASADFTSETIERANNKLRGQSLAILVGIAVARAAELKAALMEIERVLDPADPLSGLLNSILSILN
jgi:hypothetical protein